MTWSLLFQIFSTVFVGFAFYRLGRAQSGHGGFAAFSWSKERDLLHAEFAERLAIERQNYEREFIAKRSQRCPDCGWQVIADKGLTAAHDRRSNQR